MSSKIKVDTIENVAGSGNVSLGSGHNLVVPGNITGSGTATITGDLTVDTSTLKVDATNNRVGIGITSPTHPLHIVTSTDGTGVSGDDKFVALFQNAEATDGRSYGVKIMAGSTTDQALAITDHDGSNDLLALQGNGIMTLPKHPSFAVKNPEHGNAYTGGTDITTWGGSSDYINVGGHFARSTGRFTAPVAGIYQFGWWVQEESFYGQWGGSLNAGFYVNGSQYLSFGGGSIADAGNEEYFFMSALIQLAANDYVTIRFSANDSTPSFEGNQGAFYGYLIG